MIGVGLSNPSNSFGTNILVGHNRMFLEQFMDIIWTLSPAQTELNEKKTQQRCKLKWWHTLWHFYKLQHFCNNLILTMAKPVLHVAPQKDESMNESDESEFPRTTHMHLEILRGSKTLVWPGWPGGWSKNLDAILTASHPTRNCAMATAAAAAPVIIFCFDLELFFACATHCRWQLQCWLPMANVY